MRYWGQPRALCRASKRSIHRAVFPAPLQMFLKPLLPCSPPSFRIKLSWIHAKDDGPGARVPRRADFLRLFEASSHLVAKVSRFLFPVASRRPVRPHGVVGCHVPHRTQLLLHFAWEATERLSSAGVRRGSLGSFPFSCQKEVSGGSKVSDTLVSS